LPSENVDDDLVDGRMSDLDENMEEAEIENTVERDSDTEVSEPQQSVVHETENQPQVLYKFNFRCKHICSALKNHFRYHNRRKLLENLPALSATGNSKTDRTSLTMKKLTPNSTHHCVAKSVNFC
jgi:hypothetical protein